METYQAKNINKEDIDNIVKVIYNKFEEEKSKVVKDDFDFDYNTPMITLNNVVFLFQIVCRYHKNWEQKETWDLQHIIEDTGFYEFLEEDIHDSINYQYFKSKTLRELIVKYVNSKFVYDKCDNKIMRYEDYLEEEIVRKLFHTNIECCVCYDNLEGNFKTKCGHYLCLDCYNKIKGKKLCPMCKACLCCGAQNEEECEED
jgi:hypothetical protein